MFGWFDNIYIFIIWLMHHPVYMICGMIVILYGASVVGTITGRIGAENDIKRVMGKDYDPNWQKRNG